MLNGRKVEVILSILSAIIVTMTVQDTPDRWTYEAIQSLCERGQGETDTYDFKFNLQDADNHTKLCCSFANTRSGFVIIGIKEQSQGFDPIGIEPDNNISMKFGQKLRRAEPDIYFELA